MSALALSKDANKLEDSVWILAACFDFFSASKQKNHGLCLPILDCKTRISWDWCNLLICWDLPLELKRRLTHRLTHRKLLGRLLYRQLLGGLLHELLLRLLEHSCRRGAMLIDWLRELLGHLSMLLGLLLRRKRLPVWLLCLPIRLDSNEDFGITFIVTGLNIDGT